MKKFAWGGVIALLSANLLTAEIFVKESAVSIPTNVFKSKKHTDDHDGKTETEEPSKGWGSVFFGNEITVGNKFDNGFDVYASVLTGLDGFGSKDIKSVDDEGTEITTHYKFRQTFLDNTFGAGYTVTFGSSQARLGVNLFHSMDIGGASILGVIASRLYISPQLHYGYSLENAAGIPLTLGLGAEWDFGLGLSDLSAVGRSTGGGRGGAGGGRTVLSDPVYTPESNPQFWFDASYAVSEKLSFDLSAGLDINESVKISRFIDKNEVPHIPDTDNGWKAELVEHHEYKHTSLSFPIKLGVTFR
ncbi:hypothetical protein [Treponema endosymbiont of Eucomonympha sp.]|uniref:hypothetical protein n=1 Tax=Treponema endosymbiont of Eucomonympha sp. TaxID=1580831 RepID=UPI00078218C2|nr:hypothetical protein [Treponema endosymbiont of Eucomonympha sp.]